MKRILVFTICLLQIAQSNAQVNTPAVRTVTLEEAFQLALNNSTQIKKAKLEKEYIKQRLRLERGASFPQVDAKIGYDYNPVLATQFIPGDVLGRPGEPYVPVQFGQPWSLTGSVELEQVLYSEAGRRSLPAIAVTRNLYDILLERSEEEVIYQTAKVFYQTLQTEQLLRTVDANMGKFDALQRMVDLQLQNGFAIPTDVKRVRVARTNLETQRLNLLSGIEALRQTLQFFCGVPLDESFEPFAEYESPGSDSLRWLALPFFAGNHHRVPRAAATNRIVQHSVEKPARRRLSNLERTCQCLVPDPACRPAGMGSQPELLVWHGQCRRKNQSTGIRRIPAPPKSRPASPGGPKTGGGPLPAHRRQRT
ncbi:MAG: TolC family protein [Lewinellaceae bacterium]|nr:TolC family protein [Lewinellaceae bacterium]